MNESSDFIHEGSDDPPGSAATVKPIDPTIYGWCLQQCSPWLGEKLEVGYILQEFEILHSTDPNIFLLDLSPGEARLLDKPESARHDLFQYSLARAVSYRDFLQGLLEQSDIAASLRIAVYV